MTLDKKTVTIPNMPTPSFIELGGAAQMPTPTPYVSKGPLQKLTVTAWQKLYVLK